MFSMEAETLNCPMCGASVASDAPQCRYCEARLATVACPSCFAMMFLGSKHCARCGAAAAITQPVTSEGKKCPRCRNDMQVKSLGGQTLLECPDCLGLWLDVPTFEKICEEREQHAPVLGAASLNAQSIGVEKVRYIPCLECKQLMNRANFARCSGVIVDLCKHHGVWFDRDELSRIIEFINKGGLEMARSQEKIQLEEERRELQRMKSRVQNYEFLKGPYLEPRMSDIAAAGGLLKFLLR